MKKKVLIKMVAVIATVSMCFGWLSAFASEQKDLFDQTNSSVAYSAIEKHPDRFRLNTLTAGIEQFDR